MSPGTPAYAFGLAAPRCFALSDLIYLLQSDLVFELNGKPVRTECILYFTHHDELALEDHMKERSGKLGRVSVKKAVPSYWSHRLNCHAAIRV